MSKQYNEKELFDQLAKLPEELRLDEVKSMISGIADGSITDVKNSSWKNNLSTKFIIMTSTSIIISILGILYFFNPSQQSDIETELSSIDKKEIQNQDISTEETDIFLEDTAVEEPDNFNDKPAISFSSLEPMNIELLSTLPSNDIKVKKEALQVKSIPLKKKNPVQEKASRESSEKFTEITRSYPISNKYPETVPELSGIEMRKYRSTLLKNLYKDGLILSKKDYVQLRLLENEIILNDKKLNDDQFLKYRKITSRIGYGPEREIRINTEYILLGDFTEEGFIGSGRGRFEEQLIEKEGVSILTQPMNDEIKLNFEIDDIPDILDLDTKKKLEKQRNDEKELDKFSVQKSAIYVPSKAIKSLFAVNLKSKNASILHQQLYDLLLRDEMIENRESLVVIEISEANIYINGIEQSPTLSSEYYKLIKEYKISPHPNRQIRLSEFIIKVGDFQNGKFKGSIALFYD